MNDKEVAGRVYSSLIKLGDYSMFEESVRFIEAEKGNQGQSSLSGLIPAISGIHDEKMLPQLHDVMQSKDAFLGRSAIDAIRAMKSLRIVKYLINGLDNSDKEIRHRCIMGLAEIEKKGAGWSAFWGAEYDKHEQAYIDRWKDWWETVGKQKYSGK
jgi:hypothetical protein